MQTVNFQCGHCGNLMAVGSDFLGQQVRCPHCQQVVVAPPPPEPAPVLGESPFPPAQPGPDEAMMQPLAPAAEGEDIFSPTEGADDLFGRPSSPRLELPPDPLAPVAPADGPILFPHPQPETPPASAAPFLPSGAAPPEPVNGESTATLPSGGNEAPWIAGPSIEASPPDSGGAFAADQSEPFPGSGAPSLPRPARRAEQGTPWFMILVFSPLVLYSIVITIFAVMLFWQQKQIEQERRNPFDSMPDEGDNPGVQKGQKVRQTFRWNYPPQRATLPLPAHLRTPLGEPITIGELKITPERVQRRKVAVFVEGFAKPEPCAADSLVLVLTLENLSTDWAFAPLDNYFDRCWKSGMDMLPPFTQLEAGSNRFYGGPAKWYSRDNKKERREWIQGRKPFEPELLQPGEKNQFFVCTDGNNPEATLALFGENDGEKVREPYQGAFLWRIRVRRGLVRVRNKDYSATAVVGVEFTDRDIH